MQKVRRLYYCFQPVLIYVWCYVDSQVRLFRHRTLQFTSFQSRAHVVDGPFFHGGLRLGILVNRNKERSEGKLTSTVHVPICGTKSTFGFRTRPGWIFGSSSKTSKPAENTFPLSSASTRAASSITAPRAVFTTTTPSFIFANCSLPMM